MLNLLLVEDDIDLATAVVDYLDLEGIRCDHAANGVVGLNLIEKNSYHTIILDLNLPRMNGLNVCQTMRAAGDDTPVIMLTARDTLQDKVAGFDIGADDYLVKPFAMEELIVRVKALSRRKSGQVTRLCCCGIELWPQQKQARCNGMVMKLSPTALKLLEVLMRASPNPVPRTQLIEAIWGDDSPESNSLKVHIFNLRKQLEAVDSGHLLKTLKGFGFALADSEQL